MNQVCTAQSLERKPLSDSAPQTTHTYITYHICMYVLCVILCLKLYPTHFMVQNVTVYILVLSP